MHLLVDQLGDRNTSLSAQEVTGTIVSDETAALGGSTMSLSNQTLATGKGSIQYSSTLANGQGFKYTADTLLSPNGISWNEDGLHVDEQHKSLFLVDPMDEKDIAFNAALVWLRGLPN